MMTTCKMADWWMLVVILGVCLARMTLATSDHSDIDETIEWAITGNRGDNTPCILAAFEPTFIVNYTFFDSQNKSVRSNFTLPLTNGTVSASGLCFSPSANIQHIFLNISYDHSSIILDITFYKKAIRGERSRWFSPRVDLSLVNVTLPRIDLPQPVSVNLTSVGHRALFTTPVGNSFSCNAATNVSLSHVEFPTVIAVFRNVRVQAFASTAKFGPATICREDIDGATAHDNLVIPIVVGVCLCVIVIATVAVYAARKIIKQTQYNSMD